jgi:hypothetical protein
MNTCIMCETESSTVVVVRVAPATWNGFHDFATVCGECQTSRRFKLWSRGTRPKAAPKTAAGAAAPEATPAAEPAGQSYQINHRRTGALLHVVAGQTLAGASLRNAALSGADLQRTRLGGADLLRADLHLADLSEADLRGADLRGVNLRGADLRGTDFRDARLQKADIRDAVYNAETHWPQGYDPVAGGATRSARRL